MKRCGKIAACLAAGLALDAVGRAGDIAPADNPYALIVSRNVFSLRPPPLPVPTQPAEPDVKIMPNGIMSILGQAQVLFRTSVDGKPVEQSYMLGEGQGEDGIEVVKIDEKAGSVTFNNHGTVEELSLTGAPTNNGAMTPGQPVTAVNPSAEPGIGNGGDAFSPPVNNPNPAGLNPDVGQNGANNPNRDMGYGANPQTFPTRITSIPQGQQTLDMDVQKVMIVAQHLKAQQDGDPEAKIYPPTELDDEAGVTSTESPAPAPAGSPSN
jgi:hypothetical protein